MSVSYNSTVITDGLIWHIDPANKKSYSGTGTNIQSLTNQANNTLSGTYTYDTTSYTVPTISLNNDGVSSNGTIACTTADLNALALTYNFTVMFAAKKNYYGVSGNNIGNSELFQGASDGYSTGWRIIETHQGTPGGIFSSTNSYAFGFNDINTQLIITDTALYSRTCIVAFTVTPTLIAGFINGSSSSRSNPRTYASGVSSPKISFTNAGVGSFNGLLGFFMIYNRALSSTEILQNYNALRGRYGL